jgi:hypothetical protein
MKLLLAAGADPMIATIKPKPRARRGAVAVTREDPSGLAPIPEGGLGVFAIHAAAGVGYGQGFAANDHRHTPDGWMPAVRFRPAWPPRRRWALRWKAGAVPCWCCSPAMMPMPLAPPAMPARHR